MVPTQLNGFRASIVAAVSKFFNAPLKFAAMIVLPTTTRILHEELNRALQKHENFSSWELYAEALIVAEDVRFFSHRGLDIIAISRAVKRIVFYGNIQGASTIEQQLVRTLTGDYRRTLSRKIKEAFLASTLWGRVDKIDILKSYLAIAHFGNGITGLGAAIATIKTPKEFEHCQAAHVIAHLRYPLPRHVIDNTRCRRARRTIFVACMLTLKSNDVIKAQKSISTQSLAIPACEGDNCLEDRLG